MQFFYFPSLYILCTENILAFKLTYLYIIIADVSSIKQITSIKLDCHKLYENNNITSHHEAGDMKDTNSNSNMYNREPSPGIDFNQNKDEYDLQLWGYMQGYGDTAECIPDDSSINNNCKEYCISLQGVKSKGWS